ncbi:MAG TPA: vanadium-dependent haloperoxidase, partial [Thermoanaerobaculia bacterium]|nr:vanadium-dependent haloperoxidase [Thermoanaerobaculia bacterium]
MVDRAKPFRAAARAAAALTVVLALALPGAARAAKQTADHPATFAADWLDLIVERVKAEGYSPLVASRIYAYSGVALYESVVPGMPEHQSLAGQLHDLPPLPQPAPGARLDWPAVASAALGGLAKDLFPNASAASLLAFRDLYTNHNLSRLQAKVPRRVLIDSREHGNRVADAVLAWAAEDGFAASRGLPYTPPAGADQWVPTGGSSNPLPLEPFWGTLRTFALPSADTCAAPAPVPYSEDPDSAFFAEALAVYEASKSNKAEQRLIAHFWADNPRQTGLPPGHSVRITSQHVRDLDLASAAEAYALIGIAVGDAFISCWFGKYVYNLLRPETYIQRFIDPAWKPLIATPPFPEYPSGHSVQSGATNVVLAGLFGDEPFVDSTHAARGLAPRAFDSLTAAFDEAALSRLYGGIHYP